MTQPSRRDLVCQLAGLGPAIVAASNLEFVHESAEAYSVYSALISQKWMSKTAEAESLVIVAETCIPAMSPRACLGAKDVSEGIAAALTEYERLAGHPWKLQRSFHIEKQYQLVTLAAIQRMLYGGGGSWDAFYKAYPGSGGYLSLSPVGLNADKNIAVVAVTENSGPQGMSGSFSILYKKGQRWTVTKWPAGGCGWAT